MKLIQTLRDLLKLTDINEGGNDMNRNEESLNAIFNNRIVKSSVDKETIKKRD